jgi:hypothetical protein
MFLSGPESSGRNDAENEEGGHPNRLIGGRMA